MKKHNNSRKKSEPTTKRAKTRGPMRDRITRTGARAPGVERMNRSHGGAQSVLCPSAQYEDFDRHVMGTKDGCKPHDATISQSTGKAPSDRPALKP